MTRLRKVLFARLFGARAQGRTPVAGGRGFTLIELMIALFVLALILSVVYRIFTSQEKFARTQGQATLMQEDLRSVSEFLNQELSWVGYRVAGVPFEKASKSEIIFRANLPGGSPTIVSYVRYLYDTSNRRLMRAVGTTSAFVTNNSNLQILADNIDRLEFLYYDFVGGMLDSTAVLVNPANLAALRGIQRIRAGVTVRSPRPDSTYVDPTTGDHYFRRSGVIDIKTRNVEDATVSGTTVGSTGCGFFQMTLSSDTYSACADTPVRAIAGNPKVKLLVMNASGAYNNTTQVRLVTNSGYGFVKDSDPNNLVAVSQSRSAGSQDFYLMLAPGGRAFAGSVISITANFVPPEVGCVEITQTALVTITPGMPSRFDTTGPYSPSGVKATIIRLDLGSELAGATEIPVCPTPNNTGARLEVKVVDECGNGISGQVVSFTADKGSFASGTSDLGGGLYGIVYRPPDTMTGVTETATVTATWSGRTVTRALTLIPGAANNIQVVDITGPVDGGGSPLYQFAHSGANAFRIERLSNQHVNITFRVNDACGNEAYGALPRLTVGTTYGNTTPVTANPDGTYTFDWYSPFGCGAAIPGQSITVNDSGITPGAPLTITFDLLATSDVAQLVLSISDTLGLTPGCTGDMRTVTAQIQKYDPIKDTCVNVPGPFPVNFTVSGTDGALGNGSFSSSNLTLTSAGVTADAAGVATVSLYPGTARLGQTLVVRATATVEGAVSAEYTMAQLVALRATAPDPVSGFYQSGYLVRKGTGYPDRAINPGDKVYFQLKDCDENEDVFAVDSLSAPYLTVAITSSNGTVTRDREVVKLTETGANTATFRPNASLYGSDNGLETEFADTGIPGDNELQVRPGDKVTVTYRDVDGGTSNTYTWDLFVAGARWMLLYKMNGVGNYDTIIVGGAQVVEMKANPSVLYLPVLYLPQYELDGSLNTTTVTIANGTSAGETDTYTLREVNDTGLFRPLLGARDYVVISKNATAVGYLPEGWLRLPFTPVPVNVSFPPLSPYLTATFVVADSDPPTVSVTSPVSGSVVAGDVPILVSCFDVNNSIDPGINWVYLNIDGSWVQWQGAPPDRSGTTTFTWSTVGADGKPRWLDGQHRIYAGAYDKAGNWATSPVVTVTLSNGLSALWFTQPPENSVWSDQVQVGFKTSIDTLSGSYTAGLVIGGSNRALTAVDTQTWSYLWPTRPTEADGTYQLYATLRDNQANSTSAAILNVVVDHTAPTINLGAPPAWIADAFPVSATFTATDANGVAGTSVAASVTGACVTPVTVAPTGVPDQYQFTWAGPCAGTVGSVSLTVTARDLATPPNQATRTVRTSIDTRHPTLTAAAAAPTASTLSWPGTGTFVKGTSRVASRVVDDYPATAAMTFDYLGTTGPFTVSFPRPLDNPSTGAFHYTWVTTGEYQPGLLWPNGPYQATVSGTDLAGNANTGTPVSRFYVDNGVPTISYGWLPPYVSGLSPLNINHTVDANAGYLRRVGEVIYDQSNALVYATFQRFATPVSATATRAWAWSGLKDDGTPVANGLYKYQYLALDWAGNLKVVPTTPQQLQLALYRCNDMAVAYTVTGGDNHYDATVTGHLLKRTAAGWEAAADVELEIGFYQGGGYPTWSDSFSTAFDGSFTYNSKTSDMPTGPGPGRYSYFLDLYGTEPGADFLGLGYLNYIRYVPVY